jgi:integrase
VPGEDDLAKLLSLAKSPEDTIALLLLVDCAIRINELVTIKLRNISLEEACIVINGRGGKTRTVHLSKTS